MDVRPALLSGWFYLPVEAAGGDAGARDLATKLTHVPPRSFRGEQQEPVKLYDLSRYRSEGYIGIPRAYGLRVYGRHLSVIDQRVPGLEITTPKRPDPNHPSVRDPIKQRQFMDDLYQAMVEQQNFLAASPTGSGKTVCLLDAAARYGRTTLILVHLERLMDQWISEIKDKLGVPEDRIGIAQQDRCDWIGKDFAVGLLHSHARRDYPQGYYNHWGVVCFDEVHKIGSNFFAPVAPQFPSTVRVGLSATMERKDQGSKVFIWHIGPISVRSTAEALPIKVYVRRYSTKGQLWGDDWMVRKKCLMADPVRNGVIAKNIAKAYRAGRQGLVVSDSIEHLQELMRIAHEKEGVPYRAMGRFFGQVHLGKKIEIDRFGQRVPKKIRKKRTGKELQAVKDNAQIIFSTYGMMTEGIDIPRLDWGIDASPAGKATQLIGRVRRPREGKDRATWVTILDERCQFSKRMYSARYREYLQCGAEVIDTGG